MAYVPIAGQVLQLAKNAAGAAAGGYYLKFYQSGTSTPLSMGVDSTPSSTLAKCALNSRGEPISNAADEDSWFVPHIDQAYKIVLYPTSTDADNDATANALWLLDGVSNVFDASSINYTSSVTIKQYLDNLYVASYTALRALTSSQLVDGDIITVTNSGIAGDFVIKTGTVTDNGGTLIVFTDDSNRYAQRVRGIYVDLEWGGVLADDSTDNSTNMQAIFDEFRSIKANSTLTSPVYKTGTPIKIRSATKFKGLGQKIVRQGSTEVDYATFEKTTNTTVTISNPEIADQTVDCHFYLDGAWTDSVYTQKVEISDASFRANAASPVNTCLYTIQGGNYTLRNVDFFDYTYGVDGYDVWSCLCEKVVTNTILSFRRGTSIKLDQCAAGGTGNSGSTRGGYRFDTVRDSELSVCTSDGSSDTAYYFTNCRAITLTSCASENGASTSDDYGVCLHADNTIMEVNGFYGVVAEHATRATFSFGSSVKADFSNIELVYRASGGGFGAPNYDIVVTGNSGVITFRNTKWGGTGTGYGSPKIRFNSGVTSTVIVVYDDSTSDRRPIIFYSDGSGTTFSKRGLIDYGTGANGTWVRFDDGTQMCWFTAPKTNFENTGSSTSTSAQGINWYRSAVFNWTYPNTFVNSSAPHLMIQPRTGASGTRLCWPRYAGGGSNATSGDIQLIGVEDFTTAATGYTNLVDVQLFAVGRYA